MGEKKNKKQSVSKVLVKKKTSRPKTLKPQEVLELEGYYAGLEIRKAKKNLLDAEDRIADLKLQNAELYRENTKLKVAVLREKENSQALKDDKDYNDILKNIRSRLSLKADAGINYDPNDFKLKE